MDLAHPFTSLSPGLTGRVLEVLARTTAPLSGRQVQRLLDRSASHVGVQKVLDELADQGIVRQQPAGGAVLNTLNRDHVLAPFIIQIAELRPTLVGRIADILREECPEAVESIIYGSFARGVAGVDSDIDLLVIWGDDTVGVDARAAAESRTADRIRSLTGNDCQVLSYSGSEFDALGERAPGLAEAIDTDGIALLDLTRERGA